MRRLGATMADKGVCVRLPICFLDAMTADKTSLCLVSCLLFQNHNSWKTIMLGTTLSRCILLNGCTWLSLLRVALTYFGSPWSE